MMQEFHMPCIITKIKELSFSMGRGLSVYGAGKNPYGCTEGRGSKYFCPFSVIRHCKGGL